MTEYLGKQFPEDSEAQLTKIQAAILASLRPLTAAWRDLLDAGLKDNPDIAVPATGALGLIQRTICLVGNASELTSQFRREIILSAIDPFWSRVWFRGVLNEEEHVVRRGIPIKAHLNG